MTSTLLETKPREKKVIKNLLAGLICLAVTLGILFSIFAVRYHYFLKNLNDYYSWAKAPTVPDSEFPKLTSREMANLGYAHTPAEHPVSSYINFPEEKKAGVIRIGTFGDSYTQGIEAAEGHDYPSFLQQQFKKAGFDHVEVINFGVKGYGIYQSVLMWEYLGKKYDLDYIIFMLRGYHTLRDLTFIKDRAGCVGVHARYILKGDQLEFVPVVGESRKEASLNYFRMFPPLRYILYDKKAPSFMRALLPPGRDLKVNPFYRPQELSEDEEISKSYTLLFEQIAKEAKNVIVFAHDNLMGGLAKRIKSPNVYVLRSRMTSFLDWGLYMAPRSHRSALGNDLQAQELFALLTGKGMPESPVIQVHESSEPSQNNIGFVAQPLNHYEDLSVSLGGYSAGTFTEMRDTSIRHKKEIKLKENKMAGLLFLSSSQMSFLPLDLLVKQDEPVYLSFRATGNPVRIPIGKTDTVSGVMSRIILAGNKTEDACVFQSQEGVVRVDREMLSISIQSQKSVKDVKIFIGDKEVLYGKRQEKKKRKAAEDVHSFDLKGSRKFFYLSSSSGQYFPIESVEPKKGPLKLVLTHKDGTMQEIPFFLEYDIRAPDTQPFHPLYFNPIAAKNAPPSQA